MFSKFPVGSLTLAITLSFSSMGLSNQTPDPDSCMDLAPKTLIDLYEQQKAPIPQKYNPEDLIRIASGVAIALRKDPSVKDAVEKWGDAEKSANEEINNKLLKLENDLSQKTGVGGLFAGMVIFGLSQALSSSMDGQIRQTADAPITVIANKLRNSLSQTVRFHVSENDKSEFIDVKQGSATYHLIYQKVSLGLKPRANPVPLPPGPSHIQLPDIVFKRNESVELQAFLDADKKLVVAACAHAVSDSKERKLRECVAFAVDDLTKAEGTVDTNGYINFYHFITSKIKNRSLSPSDVSKEFQNCWYETYFRRDPGKRIGNRKSGSKDSRHY